MIIDIWLHFCQQQKSVANIHISDLTFWVFNKNGTKKHQGAFGKSISCLKIPDLE